MKEVVFLNGRFIGSKEARISPVTPGFLYGWGLFETMRSCNNRIVYFDQHLKRIKGSCNSLDIGFPHSLNKFKTIIEKTVKLNEFSDAYVRLTLWKSNGGTGVLVVVKKYKPHPARKYRQGFRAGISPFKQGEGSFFARFKTTNHILYRMNYLDARNKGFDEAIILNNRGYIAEASISNVFLVNDNKIFTPALACGCLDGITRKVIFDLAQKYSLEITEGNFTLNNLYAADEAFLTNSLMGVMPLTQVQDKPIGKDVNRRSLTGFFMRKYNLLLKNGN